MKTNIVSKPTYSNKEWMIFPTVNQLLRTVHSDGRLDDNLSRSMDIQGEYVRYLLKSLIKRGLVKRQWPGRYRLTEEGYEHLLRRNHDASAVFHGC